MDQSNKTFKELKQKWYQKLRKTGFKDIEQEDGNLTSWSYITRTAGFDIIKAQAKEQYYRLATHFLASYRFKDSVDKKIWTLHTSGVSIRNIAKKLKCNPWTIFKKIKKFSVLMKVVNDNES